MPNDDDKAVVRRWTAAWNDHDPDGAVSLLTEGYVRHDPNGPEVVGPAGSKMLLQAIFDAFPNLRLDEAALISEGGLVSVRYVITGTHKGVSTASPLAAWTGEGDESLPPDVLSSVGCSGPARP